MAQKHEDLAKAMYLVCGESFHIVNRAQRTRLQLYGMNDGIFRGLVEIETRPFPVPKATLAVCRQGLLSWCLWLLNCVDEWVSGWVCGEG